MDSRGWVTIDLLASFNRIRQLTTDPSIVRDVLGLSSLVEVREPFVRLVDDNWRHYIFPDAPESTVEGLQQTAAHVNETNDSVAEYEDDDDDDDLVIVMHDSSQK